MKWLDWLSNPHVQGPAVTILVMFLVLWFVVRDDTKSRDAE